MQTKIYPCLPQSRTPPSINSLGPGCSLPGLTHSSKQRWALQIFQFASPSPLTPEDEISLFSNGSISAFYAAPLASAPAEGGFWLQGTPSPPAYSMLLAKNKIEGINKFMAFLKAKTGI